MKKAIFYLTFTAALFFAGCSEEQYTEETQTQNLPAAREMNESHIRLLEDLYSKYELLEMGRFTSEEVKLFVTKVSWEDVLLGYLVDDLSNQTTYYLAFDQDNGILTVYNDVMETEIFDLNEDSEFATLGFTPVTPENIGDRKLWGSATSNCQEISNGDCIDTVCQRDVYIFWIKVSTEEFVQSTVCQ